MPGDHRPRRFPERPRHEDTPTDLERDRYREARFAPNENRHGEPRSWDDPPPASAGAAANAPEGAVAVHGGRRLRLVESRRDKLDPKGAMPVLRAAFGEVADAAVTVSKSGLKRLAGGEPPGVMAELEEVGTVQVSHSESLREEGER